MLMRQSRSSAVAAVLLAISTSAAPTIRDASPGVTAQTASDFTKEALKILLATKQADSQPFDIKPAWPSIDYAGAAAGELTPEMLNAAIFDACDTQIDRSTPTNETMSFSTVYKDFVQDVNNATVAADPKTSADVQAATDKVTKYCESNSTSSYWTVSQTYLKKYSTQKNRTVSDPTDNDFLKWADQMPEYLNAKQSCDTAQLEYDKAYDTAAGDNDAMYEAARVHVSWLDHTDAVQDGITMQVQDAVDVDDGSSLGNAVAQYRISALNATINLWQSGGGFTGYEYNSSTAHTDQSSKSTFGGAKLGISYEGISAHVAANHSQSLTTGNELMQSFSLSFKSVALLSIQQGMWFDQYKFAKETQKPDSKHSAAAGIFSSPKYFGSADAPGPLSTYNDQVLIGYQPTWMIQMQNTSLLEKASSTSAEADVGIEGFGSIGGFGGSSSNNTVYNKQTGMLTVTDQSSNAYIIGFVQKNFWDFS
ncbi:hypothetical protein FB451DRAFT_1359249 [Mycena latifolia]|nr:hypothetical protein FB451DRAFT_1359249 [Mycena latifolia]